MSAQGHYLERIVDHQLDDLLPQLPAVSIEGAKGVGKTETASRRANTVYRLDKPEARAIAEADTQVMLAQPTPVLLDEWQRYPPLWDSVRRAVDDGAPPGSFILTGSVSPDRPPTHSGAARVVTVRMQPLTLAERQEADGITVSLANLIQGDRPPIKGNSEWTLETYTNEIVRSGFPGIRHLEGGALRAQLQGYVDRIVDVDMIEFGREIRRPQALRRWMIAYAAATATTASYETIRDSATPGDADKPARSTTKPFRDILERLWIIDSVPAWLPSKSTLSQLSRSPKHHLVDPALASRLIGVNADALLKGEAPGPAIPRDGSLLGHLFESLVTQSVRVYAAASGATTYHMRDSGGVHEVDLIVEREDQRALAIEVKLSQTVDNVDVKDLIWLREKLGEDLLDAVVVNTGTVAYRRTDGIAVVPAALLGP
jgi:predicted AAA+ superfamily ATPase